MPTIPNDLRLIETLDRVLDKGIVFESVVRETSSSALDTRGNRIRVVVRPNDDDDDGGGPKRPAQQMRLARRSA